MDFPSLQGILFKFFTQLFGNTDLVQSFLVKKITQLGDFFQTLCD